MTATTTDPTTGPPGAPRPGASHRRSWIAVGVAVVGFVLCYLVTVRTGIGQRLDQAAVVHHTWDRTADRDVRVVSITLDLLAICLLPVLIWLGRGRGSLRNRLLLATALAVALAEASHSLLTRPSLTSIDPLHGASFPSGHAACAMALALGVLVLRPEWLTLAVVVPAAVADFALSVPTHRPGDLVAGFLLGFACVLVAVITAGPTPEPARRLPRAARRTPGPLPAAVGLVVMLTASTAVLSAGLLSRSGLKLADLGQSFLLGVLLVTAIAHGVVSTFQWLRPGATADEAAPRTPLVPPSEEKSRP